MGIKYKFLNKGKYLRIEFDNYLYIYYKVLEFIEDRIKGTSNRIKNSSLSYITIEVNNREKIEDIINIPFNS